MKLSEIVLTLLKDGEWHSIIEIEGVLSGKIKPEMIVRLANREEKFKGLPLQERVRKARYRYTKRIVYNLKRHGKVKYAYRDGEVVAVKAAK
jgi:hypothetical protein